MVVCEFIVRTEFIVTIWVVSKLTVWMFPLIIWTGRMKNLSPGEIESPFSYWAAAWGRTRLRFSIEVADFRILLQAKHKALYCFRIASRKILYFGRINHHSATVISTGRRVVRIFGISSPPSSLAKRLLSPIAFAIGACELCYCRQLMLHRIPSIQSSYSFIQNAYRQLIAENTPWSICHLSECRSAAFLTPAPLAKLPVISLPSLSSSYCLCSPTNTNKFGMTFKLRVT